MIRPNTSSRGTVLFVGLAGILLAGFVLTVFLVFAFSTTPNAPANYLTESGPVAVAYGLIGVLSGYVMRSRKAILWLVILLFTVASVGLRALRSANEAMQALPPQQSDGARPRRQVTMASWRCS